MAAPAREVAATSSRSSRPARERLLRLLPLAAVLLLQAVLSLRLSNSAFQDEALYLYYGHWTIDHWLNGADLYSNPSAWFTGAPQLYPVLAALLDSVGGLELARLFSTLCLLSATAAVHWTANSLFGRPGQVRVGVFAALVFAVSGPVLVLTHFATYDAPSYAAVAWALAVGVWVACGERERSRWWAVSVGGLLALAVLLKYASAIDAPFVLLAVAASSLGASRRWRGLMTSLVAGSAAIAVLALSAATWARPLVQGVIDSTIRRQSLAPETTAQLLGRVVSDAGPMIALGLLGGLLVLRSRPALGAVLLVASVAAPLYQVHTGESVSLHKTVVLGLVFGAPLAGRLCAALVDRWWGTPLVAAALLGSLVHGASVSERIFTSWPDTAPLAQALAPIVRSTPGIRIAGENPEPLQYALQEQTQPWQWVSTYDGAFRYEGLSDLPAFERALSDGQLGVVFLDGSSDIGRRLEPRMASLGYTQTTVVRTPDGGHEWVVWQPSREDPVD
ncbi:ArnT family glycosyltransferase [Geodermatophilus maliterrae]|uniref:ArnT family glycosyltransferase n=1 Tax=Geodermatophilus maliterrae TaxID=3162531 RepID=A0ABV3XAB0_9ACTN